MNIEITILLKMIANARKMVADAKAVKKQYLEKPEYLATLEMIKIAGEDEQKAKDKLSILAYEMYNKTHDKMICDQVKIVDTKTYVINDPQKAREWVLANAPALLIVDEAALINMAKAKKSIVPNEIVTLVKGIRTNIATDLSEFLE